MDLRNPHIGLAAYVVVGLIGLALVGFDPSDTELQLIFWPACAAGFAVFIGLDYRDDRRSTRR
jgi:hypothetical protein